MINEIHRHKILKQAAEYCYDVNNRILPTGYELLGIGTMTNGFEACVLKNTNDIIIAFCGTDITDINDLRNDFAMWRGKTPNQRSSAMSLYKLMHNEYPNCNITLTGHSLGGSLAQMLGAILNIPTVTFNAYGTKKILQENHEKIYSEKVINYCNPNDWITRSNAENHIGKCYRIDSQNDKLNPHKTESMKPLETRVLTMPQDLKKKNYNEESDWEYYKRTGKHKSINMFSNCAGSYPVSGYTRSDGTKVSDYIRSCGAKHLGK